MATLVILLTFISYAAGVYVGAHFKGVHNRINNTLNYCLWQS